MGLMKKVEIKGKELRKERGIEERNEVERKKNCILRYHCAPLSFSNAI